MTGADDERSGRGIVQLQSISSPDTDPPEPPEPPVPPVPPEPPDPPDPPEPPEPPPEPPEPFPVPPAASETTSPVTVSFPFFLSTVNCDPATL